MGVGFPTSPSRFAPLRDARITRRWCVAALVMGWLPADVVRAARPEDAGGAIEQLSLEGLSTAGAVEWGPQDEPPVAIFTDYRCPYSRAMVAQLTELGVHVIEYPISLLGSRELANAVICAPDRVKAMRDVYTRVPIPAGKCDTSGLDRNEAFAASHGLTEVPVLVRTDGAVARGYLGNDQMVDWLNAAQP